MMDYSDYLDIDIPEISLSNEKVTGENKSVRLNRLPMARVKCIMKLDPELQLVSQEALFMITKLTEIFVENMAKAAYTYTQQAKKKTLQKKDIDSAIDATDNLVFLEGALE